MEILEKMRLPRILLDARNYWNEMSFIEKLALKT